MSSNDVVAYNDMAIVDDSVFASFKGSTGLPDARTIHVFEGVSGRFLGQALLPVETRSLYVDSLTAWGIAHDRTTGHATIHVFRREGGA